MAGLKTKPTGASVKNFLAGVEHEKRQADARVVNEMMERITGEKGRMWGDSIVGFGSYSYTNTAGKDFEWFVTGFSPRKSALTLYIMPGYGEFDDLMARLGKHRTGRACLYINKLEDVDMGVLADLIAKSVAWMRKKYGS